MDELKFSKEMEIDLAFSLLRMLTDIMGKYQNLPQAEQRKAQEFINKKLKAIVEISESEE